ncbi:dipeptide epimerase [Brachybacterium phenoliresistens]|uniref:dipeptide epimerase n=1 Tax=Brachybacterium phenoliresistens TaxID=396014 RepID=UPI0026849E58
MSIPPADGAPAARPDDAVLTVRAVRVHRHRAALLRPFVTAARRTEAVDYVVAEVELDGGAVGQGSAADAVAVTGQSAASITAALDGPGRRALTGASGTIAELSARISAALPQATSAAAALEVALHDAWARGHDAPLAALLGGSIAGAMENDMTISLEDPPAMAARARQARAAGTRILKVKLGRDIDEDRRRLHAVLEAAPDVRLRLDANQGWSPAEAIRIIGGLEAEDLPLDLVEQPVPAADVAGLAQVRAAVGVPIMADEAVWSREDALRLIDAGAADLLNIKLAKSGGIRPALAIADAAAEAGLTCMVGAMMEPRISITAAAHLAFSHRAITLIDLDPPAWFASPAPAGGYTEDGGMLRLLGGPGLGLDRLDAQVDPATHAPARHDPARHDPVPSDPPPEHPAP